CHVKLKVLKILLHTCTQGSPQFVLQLKRNACFIREAAVFTGPPDPLHGNSLNQKVRAAAQVSAGPVPPVPVFTGPPDPLHGNSLNQKVRAAAQLCLPDPCRRTRLGRPALCPPALPLPPAGMGSSPSPYGSLQGFGFSSEKSGSGKSWLCPHLVLPLTPHGSPARYRPDCVPRHPSPGGPAWAYHLRGAGAGGTAAGRAPVRAPSPTRSLARAVKPPAAAATHSTRVSHQPGLAGGGWEEAGSGHSSQDSSQGNGELSRTSDSCSKSGSDSHSGASRELTHAAERVDADGLGDCVREVSLVSALTHGARVFLTREETQHFVKECGLLNCEVVLELLSRALEDPSDSVRMRSMCAISSFMCSDLLSLDQIFAVTREHLQQLSQGSPGPVTNRATKILRQFEALCRGQPSPKSPRRDLDPSALAVGSAPCTGDLLTDIPPLAGESILTPLSAAPLSVAAPACSEGAADTAPAPGQTD
ncbi:AP-4 complex accessory subunit tepsin, partial [Egretta garzetta]|uniref:AP-4 complex accessory subunit tepsin n=1 Tax=Egretta garzetta TaxID=188379 RepID=UPI00163D2B46